MRPGTVLGPVAAADDLRQVFLDLPQPVAVVTGLGPSGEPVGMTVSSLTSVSLAPPLVLFCPAVTARAWAAARGRGSFAVNVLGHQNGELAVRFAGPGDRFAGVSTLPTDDGIPVLADALAVLVCDVRAEHPAGDHTVVLGRVRALHALRAGAGLDTVSLRLATPPESRPPTIPVGSDGSGGRELAERTGVGPPSSSVVNESGGTAARAAGRGRGSGRGAAGPSPGSMSCPLGAKLHGRS